MKPLRIVAVLTAGLLAAAAVVFVAWNPAAEKTVGASEAASVPLLEIRWHGGGIVLQGKVRDVATQQALAQGAAARLGGETDQVTDWLDITPTGLVVADPAALAQLIRLGQEGWHLQRRPAEARLAVQSLTDARSAQALSLLQAAFGPGVPARLIQLP